MPCVDVCLATMAACVLLIRRSKVLKTIIKEWPGNEIPIFKGANSKKNSDRLDQLVQNMLSDSQFYLSGLPIVFGPKAIRQHALDCLNERRRRVHNGHDFDEVLLQA